MSNVRVYNDNDFEHVEMFKGDKISIAPKDYITMDRGDAVLFRGQFFQPRYLADGVQDPRSFKMIRIEEALAVDKAPDAFSALRCQACGYESATEHGLKVHIAKMHVGRVLDSDAKEELEQLST